MTTGQSIHERMQQLIAAGFTPKEAAALVAAEQSNIIVQAVAQTRRAA